MGQSDYVLRVMHGSLLNGRGLWYIVIKMQLLAFQMMKNADSCTLNIQLDNLNLESTAIYVTVITFIILQTLVYLRSASASAITPAAAACMHIFFPTRVKGGMRSGSSIAA